MGITTTGSMTKGGGLNTKVRCWDCNAAAPAFLIESDSGHEICGDCAMEKGLGMPVVPSSDPIGTIERRRRHGRAPETA